MGYMKSSKNIGKIIDRLKTKKKSITVLSDLANDCADLDISYRIKHNEFLKFYILISYLFDVFNQINNGTYDITKLKLQFFNQWDINKIEGLKAEQQKLLKQIEKIKTEYKKIVQTDDHLKKVPSQEHIDMLIA